MVVMDSTGCRARLRTMTSYGERVRWLVDELAAGNGRELARMAHLKNPGHVNTFLSRAATKPSAKLDPDTIERFVEHLANFGC
jgi:hypothetical protein